MEYKITGKDCFYAIKKDDIILGFYDQTTRKRAFQGAFKLMEKIVSYNEGLEKGISDKFPTCNIKCVPQQDEDAFQNIEALFLVVLIKFYTIKDFDWGKRRFFPILENQRNNYTLVQEDNLTKSTYISDEEKENFMHQFNVYTNSLQRKWQKLDEDGGIDAYLLTYDKQVKEIQGKALSNFSDGYATKTKFKIGTRNIYNYFKEYFAQNQDIIDSDIKLINSMMERYVFYGLYDYVFTNKEIEKAQYQIDAWQMIMNDALALREKHPESTSREYLVEEVNRFKPEE